MGAVGCNGTNVLGNKTKGDTNESSGYAFDACMAGKIPEKRHICAHRHKGVRRDSGGRVCVWICAGRCIDTHQTQNKSKKVIGDLVGHIWYNHVWGGEWPQGWCGRHMTTTENAGV